ncbi:MAG: tRNA pseudouridine(13) synthase TruD [Alteromonadaceae bacterium]|nr:tRNA pseudouridine(13) synthase TruD [Alteromonadaceae bacterium]|tara:strand:+ start:2233 stop:3294 length:1062 start_codon:yes stop_codon:yes gene_type:complete
MELNTDHWGYRFGQPSTTAVFKQQPQDFQVIEHLGYELTGDGEHIYLNVQKTNLNTAFVAEQLAKFCKLPLRQVTYAGRKDKYAVTQQWFGIHLPGKQDFDWTAFGLEGAKVLDAKRHNKKLRTGQLKGNSFVITLRDVSEPDVIAERLSRIANEGAPNYFGSQRFGVQRRQDAGELHRGGNLQMAERMLNGEVIRNRNKRSMALSALRSWLFNEGISRRLSAGKLATFMPGDVINLTGSNSIFVADDVDNTLAERLAEKDISTTMPLWGKGELGSRLEAEQFEQALFEPFTEVSAFLAGEGLKMERRAAIIWPRQLECEAQGDTLTVRFFLPPGCFATSILRECALITELGS